jgi:hypothetical protein
VQELDDYGLAPTKPKPVQMPQAPPPTYERSQDRKADGNWGKSNRDSTDSLTPSLRQAMGVTPRDALANSGWDGCSIGRRYSMILTPWGKLLQPADHLCIMGTCTARMESGCLRHALPACHDHNAIITAGLVTGHLPERGHWQHLTIAKGAGMCLRWRLEGQCVLGRRTRFLFRFRGGK